MNNLDWQLIETFLRVAEQGSYTKAAHILRTSQPTISRQILEIEESLGISLFVRHIRGVELTDEGRALYITALDVERGVHQFVRRAQGMHQTLRGAVRITACRSVSRLEHVATNSLY